MAQKTQPERVLMQCAASGGAPVESDERNDNYDSTVPDLAALIEHVQAVDRIGHRERSVFRK
jgi:hypothetical protein